VAWEPLRHGRADIAGIGPQARRAFSQRSADIAEHLAARGLRGSKAQRIAGHATRPPRDVHRSVDDLRPSWQDRAQVVGLGPRALDGVLDRVPRRPGPGPDPGHGEVIAGALREQGPTVTRRAVVQAWCGTLGPGAPARAVEQAADRLLDSMPPVAEHARRVEGRGVAERRHETGSRGIARERAELERLLAARGMTSAPRRGREVGRGRGDDLGFGIG
jgi:hypothetical protein